MVRSWVHEEIEGLDPESDYERICYLSQCYDFPWDAARSTELGLLNPYCIPQLSALLLSTGQLLGRERSRYDNTMVVMMGVVEYGLTTPEGRSLVRHMNRMHGHYDIAHEAFRFALAGTVYSQIKFNAMWGWRPFSEKEKLALFYFWREVCRCMNVGDYFASLEELEQFFIDYRRREFHFAEANQILAVENVRFYTTLYPFVPPPLIRALTLTLMDPAVIEACGLPKVSATTRRIVEGMMRLRARVLRYFPRRTKPVLWTRMHHASFPGGFNPEMLKPFEHAPTAPDGAAPTS